MAATSRTSERAGGPQPIEKESEDSRPETKWRNATTIGRLVPRPGCSKDRFEHSDAIIVSSRQSSTGLNGEAGLVTHNVEGAPTLCHRQPQRRAWTDWHRKAMQLYCRIGIAGW